MGDPVRTLFLTSWRVHPPRAAPDGDAEGATPEEPSVWEAAAALARRVSQEPLYLHFLRRLEAERHLAPDTRADLENQARFHAFRWAEIEDAVTALMLALDHEGVRPLLIKGISLVGDCYVPPSLRPMRDIDILIREEEIARAEDAAESAGFRIGAGETAAAPPGHHHLPPRFHDRTGTCLEIHHALVRPGAGLEGFPPLADFWSDARDAPLFPAKALIPSPTMATMLLCQHVTHADSIGRRAQNLIDLARLLELHGEEVDWPRLRAYACAPGVARCLTVPLSFLALEGLSAPPEAVLGEIRRLSRLRSWELSLLVELIRRYRIGSPPPWRRISGRISNILWRQLIAHGALPRRALRALGESLTGR